MGLKSKKFEQPYLLNGPKFDLETKATFSSYQIVFWIHSKPLQCNENTRSLTKPFLKTIKNARKGKVPKPLHYAN